MLLASMVVHSWRQICVLTHPVISCVMHASSHIIFWLFRKYTCDYICIWNFSHTLLIVLLAKKKEKISKFPSFPLVVSVRFKKPHIKSFVFVPYLCGFLFWKWSVEPTAKLQAYFWYEPCVYVAHIFQGYCKIKRVLWLQTCFCKNAFRTAGSLEWG